MNKKKFFTSVSRQFLCVLPTNYKDISKIRGAFNKFPDFFVQAFKIVLDYWIFNILLL